MFPYKCVPLGEKLNKQLLNDFHGEKTGFCAVGDKKWLLPMAFERHAEAYYTMPLKKDDVFIATFPRSGTTLTQELVWIVNNNLDFDTANSVSMQIRCPFLELNTLIHDEHAQEIIDMNKRPDVTEQVKSWKTPGPEIAKTLSSPRHFKTHLPFSLLPPNILDDCKVVYVGRNPKDVAVSYYFHNQLVRLHDYKNDFSQYWKYFKNDLVVFAPYWRHIEEAWERRNNPNMLFLYYEDMVKDLKAAIVKVSTFLGKTLNEDQIQKVYNHLQMDNLRNVPMLTNMNLVGFVNESKEGFIRKGKVGGNKEVMDETMTKEADEWIQENLSRNKISPFPL